MSDAVDYTIKLSDDDGLWVATATAGHNTVVFGAETEDACRAGIRRAIESALLHDRIRDGGEEP